MDEQERIKKAFDFSADLTKQLISLATGIIALTITFARDFIGLAGVHKGIAETAWYFFLVSIAAGIMTLASLTGNLDPKNEAVPSIYATNVVTFSIAQFLTFGVGLLLTIVFAVKSI